MRVRSEVVTAYQLQAVRIKPQGRAERWFGYLRSWIYGMALVSIFVGALLLGFGGSSPSVSSTMPAATNTTRAMREHAAIVHGSPHHPLSEPAIAAAPTSLKQPNAHPLPRRAVRAPAAQVPQKTDLVHSGSLGVPELSDDDIPNWGLVPDLRVPDAPPRPPQAAGPKGNE